MHRTATAPKIGANQLPDLESGGFTVNLKDQIVVVTGVGRGTGKTAALDFAKGGSDIALIDFDPRTIAETAEEIEALGRRVLPICTDILNWSEVNAAMARVTSEFSKIDILFNNMDITEAMEMTQTDEPDLDWDLGWNWMIGSRLKGAFFSCKAVLDTMRAQNSGRIINVAPIQHDNAEGMLMPYSVSKAGVISMTKNLANEVLDYDIRVNAITPADIEMPVFGDKLYQPIAHLFVQKEERETPKPQEQDVSTEHLEEIRSVLPLFTENSTFVTGYCHEVSGTRSAGNPWGVRGIPEINEDGASVTIEYTPPAHLWRMGKRSTRGCHQVPCWMKQLV